jgi:hypothetical protein
MLAPAPTGWYASLLWGPLDFRSVAGRWAQKIDRSRIIVVVADEDDRTATTAAFEQLLDLPRGFLIPPSTPANRSLGYIEAEALRRLNRLSLDEQWSPTEYRNLIQVGVVKTLKSRPADGPRIGGIPPWALSRVVELADAQIDAFASAGVRVIGDLERLRVTDVAAAEEPPHVEAIPLDVLADVASGLRAGHARLSRSERRLAERSIHGSSRAGLSGRELIRLLARRAGSRLRDR